MNLPPPSELKANKQRILSPHLGLYRLPLTALLSISHRLSGVVLTLIFLAGTVLLVIAACAPKQFETLLSLGFAGPLDFPIRALLGTALSVHVIHGLRHFLWDLGFGFTPRHQTAFAMCELIGILILMSTLMFLCLSFIPNAS